jgi:hypothetical protein
MCRVQWDLGRYNVLFSELVPNIVKEYGQKRGLARRSWFVLVVAKRVWMEKMTRRTTGEDRPTINPFC